MIAVLKTKINAAPKEAWSVVVMCEDELTHARAVSACKQLSRRFWIEVEFAFHWWQFINLRDPANALDATADAATADLIIVAAHADGEWPESARSWLVEAIKARKHREGALVALIGEGQAKAPVTPKHAFLRDVARNASMDFLSEINSILPRKVPESLDGFANRADQVSSTLDGILHLPDKPPQVGIAD